jgi:UDP-glucuronate 4-epimerase
MILLTGVAGFIGFHVAQKLLSNGFQVVGIDNFNDYYDVSLKNHRVNLLSSNPNFKLMKGDIKNAPFVSGVFKMHKYSKVVHLAAQAGVRYSLLNPSAYVDSNLQGFVNILESCRNFGIEHLVYASSSSVYGGNTKLPFAENDSVDHPVSLYAASKKANELMAHTYSHLFRIPTTGLRFFTVYGPWGRPDMSPMLFAKAILNGMPIDVFNHGEMSRDFTYIDDIVEGVIRVLDKPATVDVEFDTSNPIASTSNAPYRIFNIGNHNPTPLMDFIGTLESALGIEAKKNFLPMQPGDVVSTAADTSALNAWIGFQPNTSIRDGVEKFVHWYLSYYKN